MSNTSMTAVKPRGLGVGLRDGRTIYIGTPEWDEYVAERAAENARISAEWAALPKPGGFVQATEEELAAVPRGRGGRPKPPQAEPAPASAGMDATELLAKHIAPLQVAIPGLLPEGLGVLAAPPKAGKSLLAYQVAVELTLGHNVLTRKVEHRPVLYYALEDGERRSQSRVLGALGDRQLTKGLTLRWDAPRLGGPLEQEVYLYLDQNPMGVVIIDVLAKVRPQGEGKGLNAYDEDYGLLSAMHKVAKDHPGSVILFVTHDRKAGSDDWMTRVTGTRGVTGAADFAIFIERRRGEMVGVIHVSGRDIPDESIQVTFTGSGWQVADVSLLIGQASPTRQRIFDYIEKHGPVYQKAIAAGTGDTETVVYNRVADMVKDGQIVGVGGGYIVATVDETGRWSPESDHLPV